MKPQKQLEMLADGGDRYAQYLTGILYRDGGLLIPDTEKGTALSGTGGAAESCGGAVCVGQDAPLG